MTMTPPGRPRRSAGPRPGSNRPGGSRPKQAPRPEHSSRSSSSAMGTPDVHLRPATFVDLSADQERLAIEALAELLVPFLTDPHRAPIAPIAKPIVLTNDAPIGDT